MKHMSMLYRLAVIERIIVPSATTLWEGPLARKQKRTPPLTTLRKTNSRLTRLVLVTSFWLGGILGITNVSAGETEKYHGQILSEGDLPSYHPGTGQCLASKTIDCFLSLTGSEYIKKNGEKIRVIWLKGNTETRDARGHIVWRIEDTLEYPSDYRGTFDTEMCFSSAYPDTKIIAKGKWHERKPPQVGGYLRPIEKAWRVDFNIRKFVEIQTKGVVCELNEDRD